MALGLGLAGPAHAIFLEADAIETDGSVSTIDLWFFEFSAATAGDAQVNDLGGPPVPGADPDMVIYVDDGTFSNIFALDNAAGADPEVTGFPAGAYVAVIGNHQLLAGEFGPVQPDASLTSGGYDYEFNGTADDITINCLLSGNLGGGYTKRVFLGGADTCRLPPTAAVPEPASLALLGLGMLGLGVARRRRHRA